VTAATLPIDAPDAGHAGGVVGRRHLVAVQTFHIARLTSHPVVLRPGCFVAVTGKGPKGDSNESGKTSFLAATGLLLADPEWRVDAGVGGMSAAELLFEPETAGASEHRIARPDHGYVVGVFADPDDPVGTALTVWCRIATTSPHLRVRWSPGVVLATADSDRERHREADERWKALPASSEVGAKGYREALYGDTPRCLAYVARRGGLRSKPSILQMDAGAFSPTDIASALIQLTGRSAAFETEADQRRQLADTDERLVAARRHDEESRRSEDADLADVAARDRARARLDEAWRHWRLHFARGFLDVLATADTLDAERSGLEDHLAAADREVTAAEQELAGLADRDALERALTDATERAQALDEDVQDARSRQTTAQTLHGQLEERAAALRTAAGEADGRGRDACAAAVDQARARRDEAVAALGVAADRADAARAALAAAEGGGGGWAGAVRDRLGEAGIDAEVLLDAVTLTADATGETRRFWEPRLAGYRDAVVIDAADRDAAVATAPPGAVLVAGEPTDREPPAGVAAAPRSAGRFLHALAGSGTTAADPDRVTFTGLGVTVVGGFADPVTGREARVAAARQDLAAAESAESRAQQQVQAAERDVEVAEHALAAAEAEAELAAVREQLAAHERAIAEAEAALARLSPQLEEADAARRRAENAVDNHDTARQQAQQRLEQAQRDRDELRRQRDDLTAQRDGLPLAYWRDGWGGTREEAQAALADEPRSENRLRRVASDLLLEALQGLGIQRDGSGADSTELAGVATRRERLEADADGAPQRRVADFATVTAPLREWLDAWAERDRFVEDTITTNRAQRAEQLDALQRERAGLADALDQIQDAVEQRITQTLQEIASELDRLDRHADGFGADLHIESHRPEGPTAVWVWRVTPLWRRAAGGRLVRYDNQTNSAREKLFTVHLVLAALLAAPDPTGRVLILDELGDSLGVTHRRDVLGAVADVARDRGITVLGTCQDAVLPDATRVAGEILYFSYPSRAELLNQPVRCWGFDAQRERVELTADALRAGRPLV